MAYGSSMGIYGDWPPIPISLSPYSNGFSNSTRRISEKSRVQKHLHTPPPHHPQQSPTSPPSPSFHHPAHPQVQPRFNPTKPLGLKPRTVMMFSTSAVLTTTDDVTPKSTSYVEVSTGTSPILCTPCPVPPYATPPSPSQKQVRLTK